jgi:hypothetical protein
MPGKGFAVTEQWETFLQILRDVGKLLAPVWHLILAWLLLIVWIIWWLCAANWRKTWAVLGQGAWVPVVLLVVVGSLVWSQMAPSDCRCLGVVTVSNFWWQLGAVGLLAAVALFCGWLQGVLGWTPAEIDLDPEPSAAHDHGSGHH